VSARDAAGAVWLGSATFASDGAVWWQEIRPYEGGRGHLLRASADGRVTDVPVVLLRNRGSPSFG